MSHGIAELIVIDLQGLLTALRVHADDPAYVEVREMVGTDGRAEACFIIPDSVLRKWGVLLYRAKWPWLVKALARDAGAGA